MLENLFVEAIERLVWDKHIADLYAIGDKLEAMLKDQPEALRLFKEYSNIYFEMPAEAAWVLAALAPYLACRPLAPETLLTEAIKAAGLDIAPETAGNAP